MAFNKLPPLEVLQDRLNYDPDTGVFTWKNPTNRRIKVGDVAGHKKPDGRLTIRIDGSLFYANRIAWKMMTGSDPTEGMEIDHINRNRADDRWENLRMVTPSVNTSNRDQYGLGASFSKLKGKWVSRRKGKFLGYYDTKEDAILAAS